MTCRYASILETSQGVFFGLLRGYNFQKTIWTTAITRGMRHKRKNIASKSCGDVPERKTGHIFAHLNKEQLYTCKDNFVGDVVTLWLWTRDSIEKCSYLRSGSPLLEKNEGKGTRENVKREQDPWHNQLNHSCDHSCFLVSSSVKWNVWKLLHLGQSNQCQSRHDWLLPRAWDTFTALSMTKLWCTYLCNNRLHDG